MWIQPTVIDFHLAAVLARFLGKHPLLDLCVESAIRHHVLGGLPFAVALFVLWVQAEKTGRTSNHVRILTILFASLLSIAFAVLAGLIVSWLPPSRQPSLAHLYPGYLMPDINTNSFPSQSTSVYTSIAVGILSLNRTVGICLLGTVLLFVSLPRLYIGGHFLTDVLAGLVLGLVGYIVARFLLERGVSLKIEQAWNVHGWKYAVLEICVFLWILEVAVDFQEGVWILNAWQFFHARFFS